ncbi:MAG: 50S ribosomal protein L5 [Nitrospirae bacterium]|nr:50S ribosomal protein L5 [Nitrospirota bacterium]MCL5236616.1 50S ribosomal protein L5 [Nitrospirota bacterium]
MAPRLKEKYTKEAVPAIMKEFSYRNIMQVPKLEKIIVHVTLGEATQNIKLLDAAEKELATITGQKPLITKSKKAIAGFKLKQDVPLGCKVTLRGERMYEFMDRLISLALPRIRDFRGLSAKSFDGRGNYSFGLKEQYIFPEIDYDKVEMVHGLDITMCTSAGTDAECKALLRHMGMPFRK